MRRDISHKENSKKLPNKNFSLQKHFASAKKFRWQKRQLLKGVWTSNHKKQKFIYLSLWWTAFFLIFTRFAYQNDFFILGVAILLLVVIALYMQDIQGALVPSWNFFYMLHEKRIIKESFGETPGKIWRKNWPSEVQCMHVASRSVGINLEFLSRGRSVSPTSLGSLHMEHCQQLPIHTLQLPSRQKSDILILCERRSCMKNDGKTPTFKFASGRGARWKFSRLCAPPTRQRNPLGFKKTGKPGSKKGQGWEFLRWNLEIGVVFGQRWICLTKSTSTCRRLLGLDFVEGTILIPLRRQMTSGSSESTSHWWKRIDRKHSHQLGHYRPKP